MKAVLLAAGEGYRCRPLTLTRSKVMLPVANKPILEHIINALKDNDITDIILVVGYKKERVMDYFENGLKWDINISYVEQRSLLGTAHAIKLTKDLLEEDFLVLNGDNLIDKHTIADLLKDKKPEASILVTQREHITGYGVVCHTNNKMTRIVETPKEVVSHLINTGVYFFTPAIFKEIDRTTINEYGEYSITDTLQLMADSGYDIHVIETNNTWIDTVNSWNLLEANSTLLSGLQKIENHGTIENGAHINGNVSIGKGSIVRPGSYILGPVVIGEDCVIGANSIILPATAIGDHTHIEGLVNIQNSIIMDNVDISSHSNISDSIIGSDNKIQSHFITEVGKNLKIEIREEIHTAPQLGTVIGDYNTLGNRVTILAGCMIETQCNIHSNTTINRDVPNKTTVM